jgi:hypothetical protein
MEETNHDRAPLELISSPTVSDAAVLEKDEGADVEKFGSSSDVRSNAEPAVISQVYAPQTYLQKLTLLDKPRPFQLPRVMARPLILLTFPVVAYAGFSYGSNLVWFNVLNGTASLILSRPPYNFSVGCSPITTALNAKASSPLWSVFPT